MLAAEKNTCKVKQYAWSPKYSQAVEEKNFWKILLTLKRNHERPTTKTEAWATTLGIPDITSLTESQINSNLRKAHCKLKEIKREAAKWREEHLRELLWQQQEMNDDRTNEKSLRILIRAHQKQHSYRKIQFILKPKQCSGLSHILVPENSQPEDYPFNPDTVASWKMIHDHTLLQKYLLQWNMKHFNRAHGTPFTMPPLGKLDWEASNDTAKRLLQREIPPELYASENPFVREVLDYIASRQQLPEFDIFITPDEVARGYRRWKETTSTSPSGCHL
jgi:hypothetical protein